jgi:hypothetical protein
LGAGVSGYAQLVSDDSTQHRQNPGATDRDERAAEDVLEAFNAGDVLENPDGPLREPQSPADDTDVPPPG